MPQPIQNIEITEEMIDAGLGVLFSYEPGGDDPSQTVTWIFEEMMQLHGQQPLQVPPPPAPLFRSVGQIGEAQ